MRLVSKMVCSICLALASSKAHHCQLVNVCVTLNEYPYIRYYFPTHHAPLGAFKPHESTRAPPPAENASRWRTQLARGEAARAYEVADTDFVTKVLAFMVQRDLDEYKKSNPEWPVSARLLGSHAHSLRSDTESVRSASTTRNHDHYRPRHGHARALHSRVHVPSDGERPATNRRRD